MYIQSPQEDNLQLPQGYSGNAFRREGASEAPTQEESAPTPLVREAARDERNEQQAAAPPQEERAPSAQASEDDSPEASTPAGSFFGGRQAGRSEREGRGLLGGLSPLLSSLLPPPRKNKREHSDIREWVLIGVALLLFLSEETDDLLPLLLLLLLWD